MPAGDGSHPYPPHCQSAGFSVASGARHTDGWSPVMHLINDFVEASAPLYLENLKYLGISLNMENSRNSVQPQEEKFITK